MGLSSWFLVGREEGKPRMGGRGELVFWGLPGNGQELREGGANGTYEIHPAQLSVTFPAYAEGPGGG